MTNVERIQCGNGNCYIVHGEKGSILLDTAKEKHKEMILEKCRDQNIRLIVLTHTHIDHCQNAKYLAKELNVPIAIAKEDESLIVDNRNQKLYAKTLFGKIVLRLSVGTFEKEKIPFFQPDVYLKEGDTLEKYGVNATVIALPGHTNGSIGLDLKEDGIIVGDALMNMGRPSISLLYHDYEEMLKSAAKISLYGDRTIYFGHGKPVKNRVWK